MFMELWSKFLAIIIQLKSHFKIVPFFIFINGVSFEKCHKY